MSISIIIFTLGVYFNESTHNDCLASYPKNGTFLKSPPYWKYENCESRSYNRTEVNNCLTNRTVYFIGISTTRQFAFDLSSLIGGINVDSRDTQKAKCSKVSDKWEDSCHENLSNNIAIKYLFFHWMDGFNFSNRGGFPYLYDKSHAVISTANEALKEAGETEEYPFDMCTSFNTSTCLEKYLSGSKSDDILLFSVGGPYGTNSKVVNFTEFLIKSAINFKGYINAHFRGRFVFYVTLSMMFDDWEPRNPYNYNVNTHLYDLWFKNNSNETENKWRIIDQWSINRGRKRYYEDRIHFPGHLSLATIFQMLTVVCPILGTPVPNVTLPNDIDLSLKSVRLSPSSDKQINSESQRHDGARDPSISRSFEDNDVICDSSGHLAFLHKMSYCRRYIQISESNEISLKPEAVDLLPTEYIKLNCTDGLVLRIPSSKSIWQFCRGSTLKFQDWNSFVRLGYDSDEIQVMPINIIPFLLSDVNFVKDRCGLPNGQYPVHTKIR